jgi:myosin-5
MDDKLEIYTKGTKAWFRDKEEAYVSATMATKEISDKIVKMEFFLDATQKVLIELTKVDCVSRNHRQFNKNQL